MEHAGRVTRAVLEAIKAAVRPGVSTQELDQIGARVMQENGARSAPKLTKSSTAFPVDASLTTETSSRSTSPLKQAAIWGTPAKRLPSVPSGRRAAA